MLECKNVDYYTGFEGEGEIVFVNQNERVIFEFKMWIGYFNSILNNINSVALESNNFLDLYYLQEGWFDESPFEIKDVAEVIYLFKEFNIFKLTVEEKIKINSMSDILVNIKKDLIDFLEFSLDNGCVTTISYL